MTKSTGHYEINGCTLTYSRDGSGELVVLLHGALADESMWDNHMQNLSATYDVAALTQRHFGDAVDAKGEFGLNTHAQDLVTFIQALTTTKVHMVGWSYGADVALNAAVAHPGLFKSLLVYEPGYGGYLSDSERAVLEEDAGKMFGPIFQLAAEGKWEAAVRTLINGSGNSDDYFESQTPVAKAQQLEKAHTLAKQLHQKQTPNLTMHTLSQISIPTTVAYGERSRSLFKVVAQAAGGLIPHCRLLCVPSANHMLPIENPATFSDLIATHVEQAQR